MKTTFKEPLLNILLMIRKHLIRTRTLPIKCSSISNAFTPLKYMQYSKSHINIVDIKSNTFIIFIVNELTMSKSVHAFFRSISLEKAAKIIKKSQNVQNFFHFKFQSKICHEKKVLKNVAYIIF